MTTNEAIIKLASKQAQLTQKLADCTVLRNEIAGLKHSLKVLKQRDKDSRTTTKPAAKKPSTSGRKTTKK